jgi:DNA-directed RNA polymerase specialized sigma24 family protein
MSEKRRFLAKEYSMVHLPDPSNEELRALRTRLRHSAAAGGTVPAADVEDVAQEAMLKLVREERREDAPSLVVRGFVALRQARAEYFRRRSRAKEPPLEALELHEEVGRADAEARLMELEDMLRALCGEDALEMARARQAGMTERELAEQPGWTPQRAGAARKRLKRAGDRLRSALLDD